MVTALGEPTAEASTFAGDTSFVSYLSLPAGARPTGVHADSEVIEDLAKERPRDDLDIEPHDEPKQPQEAKANAPSSMKLSITPMGSTGGVSRFVVLGMPMASQSLAAKPESRNGRIATSNRH